MNDCTDVSELAVSRLIDNRYRLTQLLRAGGMSRIYLAEDTRLFQRQVVVKLLSLKTPETDQQLRKWFAREAQISIMLGNHPRIVTVLDYGVDRDQPYLVMEYLGQRPQGCDLEEYLATRGNLSPAHVINLGGQICSGLAHAHEFTAQYDDQMIRGVIHRDLKPGNIFVTQQAIVGEIIKILDFGIAKIIKDVKQTTASNIGFVGTLSHASPEHMRGEDLTPSSDIYSLGVVFYKMMTGVLPFSPPSQSFQDWYTVHTEQDPLPLNRKHARSIPQALEDVVMACLEKDPSDRPASMQILGKALQESMPMPHHRPPAAPIKQAQLDTTTQVIRSHDGADQTRPVPPDSATSPPSRENPSAHGQGRKPITDAFATGGSARMMSCMYYSKEKLRNLDNRMIPSRIHQSTTQWSVRG